MSMCRRLHGPIAIGDGLLLAVLGGRKLFALTPESPAVQSAIEKGVAFLAASPAANDSRVAPRALVGLVFLNSDADPKHPRITEAVAAIQGAVRGHGPAKSNLDIYSAGLSVKSSRSRLTPPPIPAKSAPCCSILRPSKSRTAVGVTPKKKPATPR